MPALVGPVLVGVVLAFAGLAKALEPDHFVRHLRNLRLFPEGWLLPLTVAVASFQCGLAAALMLRVWPPVVLPAAMLSLLGLAALGYWSTATGRTPDCGCYNGLVTFSPLQSLLLDVGYVALLGISWWWGVTAADPRSWRGAVVLLAALAGGGLAWGLSRYSARNGKPLVELTPMRVGRPWNPRWVQGLSMTGDEDKLVVFLGANCSHCMKWIKPLNTVHHLPGLPSVQGVVTLAPERLPDYLSRSSARFPVVAVTPWESARLSRGITPTAVVIREGIIREKWIRNMPKAFTDRLRAQMPPAG